MKMPVKVAEIRKKQCARYGCVEAHDFFDSCAVCEKGQWGMFDIDCHKIEPALEKGIIGQAMTFAKASASHFATGMQKRDDAEAAALLNNFCRSCEFFRPSDGRCSKCTCFMAIKTTWKSEHCPVGKW